MTLTDWVNNYPWLPAVVLIVGEVIKVILVKKSSKEAEG